LRDLLPPPRWPTRLAHHGEGFVAVGPDGTATPLGPDLEDAYDAVCGDPADVAFDPSVFQHLPEGAHSFLGSSIGVPTQDGSGSVRLLLAHTDEDRLRSLEDAWDDFLDADAAWRPNPADFYNSWTWLDRHPAFWIRSVRTLPGDEDWDHDRLWRWETSGYCAKIYLVPFRDDDGQVVVSLEAGGRVRTEQRHIAVDGERQWVTLLNTYWTHFHDYRLDTQAPTYEDGIVHLAGLVDRFFDTEGNERPGVDHEVPQWVAELESRIADRPHDKAPPEVDLYRPHL
jgi:hypothetical protein